MSGNETRARARRHAFIYAVVCVVVAATSGCQAMFATHGDASASPVVKVERDDPIANMSPDQRDHAFRGACAEGMDFVEREQYGLALGAFEKALQFEPDSMEAMFNIAACHDAMGDLARAINIYRRILQINPDDADCYANLGTSYIKMYHRENSPAWRRMARKAWEQSLRLNPEQETVRKYLAQSETLE